MFLASFVLLLVPGYVFGVVAHEIGHALLGSAVGIPIRLITIGSGPILLQGRIGEIRVEWRRVPLGGMVHPYPPLTANTCATLAFYAGGALANIAVIGLIAVLARPGLPPAVRDAFAPVAWAQLYIVVVALLPFRTRGRNRDGWLILQALRRPASGTTQTGRVFAAMLARYDPAREPTFSRASARIAYQLGRRAPEPERQDACRALLRELDRRHLRPSEELLILDALVTQVASYGDPMLRPRLDELSTRALQLGPDVGTLRGSRGAALVELGRYDEGRDLLAPLAAGAPSMDALFSQLFLARALCKLGDTAAARRWLDAARAGPAADLAHPSAAALLERVEAELG